jgi:tRNA dimethylallyltransferase
VAWVGPTGVGKSSLSLQMARNFKGEIINADSLQVYRFMNIGTAKPSATEMKLVPHHLFDRVNPDEEFSLAQYQYLAFECIRSVQERGHVPFLVGGSGQYLWAVLEGWQIPRIPPNLEFRGKLEQFAREKGVDALYEQLLSVDPLAGEKIDKRNIRRVIRALEVAQQTTHSARQSQTKLPPDFDSLIIGLTASRSFLYERLDARVERMMQEGLVSEVQDLCQRGYSLELPALNSIGYKQIGRMLKQEISLEEAIRLIKVDNHRFVRHQYAWFKLEDTRIHWFNIEKEIEAEIKSLLSGFLYIA